GVVGEAGSVGPPDPASWPRGAEAPGDPPSSGRVGAHANQAHQSRAWHGQVRGWSDPEMLHGVVRSHGIGADPRRPARGDAAAAGGDPGAERANPSLRPPLEETIAPHYPEARRLQQIKGVGPVTARAFVLFIEDPSRFSASREVGAYFGLVPRLDESSDSTPQLRITKAGD